MKPRGWAWVLAVLAVVGMLTVAAIEFRRPASSPRPEIALGDWQIADVKRISIVGPQTNVLLRRENRGWVIDGKRADAQAVRHLLDDLRHMRVVRVVAWNRSHDKELGLDKPKGRELRLEDADGRLIWHCWIGRQGSDLATTYIRLPGEARVLAVDRMLRWQILRTPDAWQQAEQNAPSLPEKAGEEGKPSRN